MSFCDRLGLICVWQVILHFESARIIRDYYVSSQQREMENLAAFQS